MSEAGPRSDDAAVAAGVPADAESSAAGVSADAERLRRNPFAVTLVLIACVGLLVGGALVVTGAALEHLVRPPDVLAGASFSSASTPWLFVGAIAALLWLAVAAVRWHVDDRGR
ncbi:hypothetical protein [uncultured Amnibacterium sp.]|uniref:hypothetical protein n=1 Tax=uncultured Amnibacterium sp. TaxID=1631851 RepID=UPI0035C966AF